MFVVLAKRRNVIQMKALEYNVLNLERIRLQTPENNFAKSIDAVIVFRKDPGVNRVAALTDYIKENYFTSKAPGMEFEEFKQSFALTDVGDGQFVFNAHEK